MIDLMLFLLGLFTSNGGPPLPGCRGGGIDPNGLGRGIGIDPDGLARGIGIDPNG